MDMLFAKILINFLIYKKKLKFLFDLIRYQINFSFNT